MQTTAAACCVILLAACLPHQAQAGATYRPNAVNRRYLPWRSTYIAGHFVVADTVCVLEVMPGAGLSLVWLDASSGEVIKRRDAPGRSALAYGQLPCMAICAKDISGLVVEEINGLHWR